MGPLSLLLTSDANSLTWTMVFIDAPGTPISADLFNAAGGLVNSLSVKISVLR